MSKSWITTRFTNPVNDSITGKYIQIKKFSQDDSMTILNALKNKDNSVYFQDTTGNIKVNSTQFINPLLSKPWDNTVSLSSYKISLNPESNYIFSKPHGAWALYYKTNNILYMLYNPIPRPEWSQKYINFNYTDDIYEETVKVCTDTKSEDPVCGCISLVSEGDTEFCMDQLFAGGDSRLRKIIKYNTINAGYGVESGPGSGTWNSISNLCHCKNNTKCSNSHPFEKTHLINNRCPENLQISICAANINAGGNITQTSPTSFNQSCTNISGGADPTKPTPQTATGPSDNSGTSGPSAPSGPSGATGASGQYTNSELSPVSTIKKIIYIGGGLVIIALIAYGLYSFLFSSEKPTKSIVNTPIIEELKPPVIETVKPPVIETVKPPVIETVKPPVIETVKPPVIETVKPPVIETVKSPVIETVKPPVIEPLKAPLIETVKPAVITPANAPIIEPVKAAFKASFRFKRR